MYLIISPGVSSRHPWRVNLIVEQEMPPVLQFYFARSKLDLIGSSSDTIHFVYKDFGLVPFDSATDGTVLFLVWLITIVTCTL